jgi:hypothetical protein
MSNPTELHHQYALRVLNYLYTTNNPSIRCAAPVDEFAFDVYSKTTNLNLNLHAYSDASFADADDRKSTPCYLLKFTGGTVFSKHPISN